jgi:hypothetical protein
LKRDVVTKVQDLDRLLLLLAVLDMRVMGKLVKPIAWHRNTRTLLRRPPGQVSGFLALSGKVPRRATIVTRHFVVRQRVERAPRHGHISGIISR